MIASKKFAFQIRSFTDAIRRMLWRWSYSFWSAVYDAVEDDSRDRKELSVEAAALAFGGMVALICLGTLFGAFYL